MNLSARRQHYFRDLIDRNVKALLNTLSQESADYNLFVTNIYKDISEFLSRGRGLGSLFTLMIYTGYHNFKPSPDIINIATALELYSFSILIHDDIIDSDTTRMGYYTFHSLYETKAPEQNSQFKERFGKSIAILVGNILGTLSFETLSQTSLAYDTRCKVLQILSSGFRRLNESQIVDLLFEGLYPSSTDWYTMASCRAALHVNTCITIGGIIAGWDVKDQNLLQNAAKNIGYMLDIRDDINDTFRRCKEQKDIKMRKKPLHFCYALQKASGRDKARIINLIEQPIDDNDELIRLLAKYGLDEALSKLEDHGHNAIELIKITKLNSVTKKFFDTFVTKEIQKMNNYRDIYLKSFV
jgi:geranylgeranyl diphosphate synthase, type I